MSANERERNIKAKSINHGGHGEHGEIDFSIGAASGRDGAVSDDNHGLKPLLQAGG
jgi:hypothetical protein